MLCCKGGLFTAPFGCFTYEGPYRRKKASALHNSKEIFPEIVLFFLHDIRLGLNLC